MVFILSLSTSSEAGLLNQQSKQRCSDFFTPFSPLEGVQENLKQVPEPPQLTQCEGAATRLQAPPNLMLPLSLIREQAPSYLNLSS